MSHFKPDARFYQRRAAFKDPFLLVWKNDGRRGTLVITTSDHTAPKATKSTDPGLPDALGVVVVTALAPQGIDLGGQELLVAANHMGSDVMLKSVTDPACLAMCSITCC